MIYDGITGLKCTNCGSRGLILKEKKDSEGEIVIRNYVCIGCKNKQKSIEFVDKVSRTREDDNNKMSSKKEIIGKVRGRCIFCLMEGVFEVYKQEDILVATCPHCESREKVDNIDFYI